MASAAGRMGVFPLDRREAPVVPYRRLQETTCTR
jgi:hypothetical protein